LHTVLAVEAIRSVNGTPKVETQGQRMRSFH
jgi:hypothetical protein